MSLFSKKPTYAEQCVLCGFYVTDQPAPVKCPKCGCRRFRNVSLRHGIKNAELDRVSPEAVAHLTKRLEKCLNYDLDPATRTKVFHDLKISRDVTRNPQLVTITESCSECGLRLTSHSIPVQRTDVLAKLGIKLEDIH